MPQVFLAQGAPPLPGPVALTLARRNATGFAPISAWQPALQGSGTGRRRAQGREIESERRGVLPLACIALQRHRVTTQPDVRIVHNVHGGIQLTARCP